GEGRRDLWRVGIRVRRGDDSFHPAVATVVGVGVKNISVAGIDAERRDARDAGSQVVDEQRGNVGDVRAAVPQRADEAVAEIAEDISAVELRQLLSGVNVAADD